MEISHPIPHTYCKYCELKLKESLISSHENICDKKAEFMNRCSVCEKPKNNHNQNNCIEEMKRKYESKVQSVNNHNDYLTKELNQAKNELLSQKAKIEQMQGKSILI
jgi:predicted nuclease with TOPRIM domain